MVAMSCKAWLSSQSWLCLSSALVASGLSSRNANGMMISKKSMIDEDDDGDDLDRGRGFPGDQVVQRGEIGGAGDADQRADEHGEPEPGLTQYPLRPAVLLLRLLRRPVPGRDWYLAPAVQAARGEQRAGGEQEQAEGQVDARAHRALGLDGIGVEDQHVQQADRHGHGHAAEQQAQEHRPRPPVLDQQQIHGQQLRVQRRQERQGEELGVHLRSASIGHRARLVARAGWWRSPTCITYAVIPSAIGYGPRTR